MAGGAAPDRLEVAVVGAGWAGLAAAIEASRAGARVTLYEMAPAAGGRARDILWHRRVLDNGAHICIGAYVETLRLLRIVGVDEAATFARMPLTLVDGDGKGLRMRAGRAAARVRARGARPARLVVARALRAAADRGSLAARRLSLPAACDRGGAQRSVAGGGARRIHRALVRRRLEHAGERSERIGVPARSAGSARRQRGRRRPAAAAPAARRRLPGARARLARRQRRDDPRRAPRRPPRARRPMAWSVDGARADRVIVASSAVEAARLVAPHDSAWAARAAALRYEPIATVYALSVGCMLPEPLIALHADAERPAQFVFDLGRLGRETGLLGFVISGASAWVARGVEPTEAATLAQAGEQLAHHLRAPLEVVRTVVEKRATFACTPELARPPMTVAPGMFACGDYVEGPFPATLEGAVRSGIAAAAAATRRSGENSA